jgi:putative ABC transport system substrate-binding protein
MKRRELMTLFGGAAAACPFTADAQQPAVPVVGFLNTASPNLITARLNAFRQGLSETGFVEGRNVAIEHRWADDQYDRLPRLAAELVARRVAVIVAASNNAATVSKTVTATTPIVFFAGINPVEIGLVASLSRPGGNLTGVTTLNTEIGPKRLELLHELLPTAATIVALINPTNANAMTVLNDLQAAAGTLSLQLHVLHASTERDVDAAFTSLGRLGARGLVIGPDAFFNDRSELLATLALRHAVPTIYQYREFAAAGGLMSYGTSITDAHRLVGIYTGRILKGEKPADLPVQQATRVELIINMKTAKALGLTFPITLLGRADEVIE